MPRGGRPCRTVWFVLEVKLLENASESTRLLALQRSKLTPAGFRESLLRNTYDGLSLNGLRAVGEHHHDAVPKRAHERQEDDEPTETWHIGAAMVTRGRPRARTILIASGVPLRPTTITNPHPVEAVPDHLCGASKER